MSSAVPEQYRHLIQTIIGKLIVRNAAVQNRDKTHMLASDADTTREKLSDSISRNTNKVNMSKYEILSGMYLTDRYTAIQRLVRFALVCVVFTCIVMYLGIHSYVPVTVAVAMCLAWWTVLLVVAVTAVRTYLSRDKLFWNKFVWADPPMNAVSVSS
jgi:membrane-associated HD superfamily phosphohydrolase